MGSDKKKGRKGKAKGDAADEAGLKSVGARILILRYYYSEIAGEFLVPPEHQGNTLQQVVDSNEFFDHVEALLDEEKTGIDESIKWDMEAFPFVEGDISVVEFAEKGGCIMVKPTKESQEGRGTTSQQALEHRDLLKSSKYLKFLEQNKPLEPESVLQKMQNAIMELQEAQQRCTVEERKDNMQNQNVIQSLQRDVINLNVVVGKLNGIVETQQLEINTLKLEINTLKQKSAAYEMEISTLNGKVRTFNEKVRTFEQENNDLKDDVKSLEAAKAVCEEKMQKLEAQVAALLLCAKPFQLVVIRKLLDKFRSKVRAECKQKQLSVPSDWNHIVFGDNEAGVSCRNAISVSIGAFWLSRYGQDCLQFQAGQVLHVLEQDVDQWDKTVYAGHILPSHPDIRKGLCQIYEYVFGSSAEHDAWEDVDAAVEAGCG